MSSTSEEYDSPGDIMSTLGVFSTLKGYYCSCEAYHEYIARCLVCGGLPFRHGFCQLVSHMNHGISDVLMIILDVIVIDLRHPSVYSWYSLHESLYPSNVLNTPQCTQDIALIYSKVFLRCTVHRFLRVGSAM